MPKETKDQKPTAGQSSSPQSPQRPPNVVAAALFIALFGAGLTATIVRNEPLWLILGSVAGLFLACSPKVARQWERAIVLRLGQYVGRRGPGLFWVIPGVDTIAAWVDHRIITTTFAAEESLTADTVPVNVDAVLFWMVNDAEKAALEVQDYKMAVSWAAQTALRDVIGRTPLNVLLRGREQIESDLQKLIDERSTPWGVTVQSVEMRDIVIPESLQDAMSREAQAKCEKEARIILGQAEVEIAHLFESASHSYQNNPTAMHLRAMNILYEGLKEKGALMLVPSTAVESMGLGGMMGTTALRQQTLSRADGAAEPLGNGTVV